MRSILFFLFGASFLLFCSAPNTTSQSAKAELGRFLFFTPALSANGNKACASCHDPQFAFTDGYDRSTGIYGDKLQRNAPSLLQVSERKFLTWACDTCFALEAQMQKPLFEQHPPEMGLSGHESEVLQRLQAQSSISALHKKAFPNSVLTLAQITESIMAFEQKLISRNSNYDRFLLGETHAISEKAARGKVVFDALDCGSCHGGKDFDQPAGNNYFVSVLPLAPTDFGLQQISGKTADAGKFRIPSLRNVALTAPYFHDGRLRTLAAVIDQHSRVVPNTGEQQHGYRISEIAKNELIAFLFELSDTSYLYNPYFNNPYIVNP